MPFDMGAVTPFPVRQRKGAEADSLPALAPAHQTAGAVLRAAREAQGRTLPQLAEATRVRRAYLQAIEDMRPDLLPSRPFAVGYAKAYARALGLDAEDLAERFKTELPGGVETQALRAPVGVANEEHAARWPLMAGGVVALLAVVLLWNVAQRAVTFEKPEPAPAPEAPEAWLRTPPPSTPVPLAPPAPAPSEQTIPTPYVTPGLEEFAAQQASGMSEAPSAVPAAQTGATLPPAAITAAQGAKAQAFGGGDPALSVMLRARRPASLVVRTPEGRVVFARHLQAGDSWRNPVVPGLVIEVSEPAAWDVYAYGVFKGQLSGPAANLPQLAG
ncbi:MAG: helix-turn-helix domain-containing protein [Proteobacteria bacterium]|nr:helix-turn-helix domain-containing protein [Pseudomonadota bacterium]